MKTLEDMPCSFPVTLEEALTIQARESTRGVPLAGGTDLMVQWPTGAVHRPDRVIDVSQLAELEGINEEGDVVIIGAATTHAQLRASSLVREYLPSLAQAAGTVGGAQIQAVGTIAGNVANASPAGDLAPSLLITDGHVVVASASGEREIELNAFFLAYRKIDLRPDELIVRFRLPKCGAIEGEKFTKLGPRGAQAISKVMASYRGSRKGDVIESFRVAIGSVAPTAIRLPSLEAWLVGRTLNEETMVAAEKMASDAVSPISDIRSTEDYRKWVSGRIVRGCLQDLARTN